jgi:hypothetical protein
VRTGRGRFWGHLVARGHDSPHGLAHQIHLLARDVFYLALGLPERQVIWSTRATDSLATRSPSLVQATLCATVHIGDELAKQSVAGPLNLSPHARSGTVFGLSTATSPWWFIAVCAMFGLTTSIGVLCPRHTLPTS